MKMIYALAVVAAAIIACSHSTTDHENTDQGQDGIAVVELFTSEGCSSCPPADEAIIDLAGEKRKHVFILAFHVDYWDALGWKDGFSSKSSTLRQQQYESRLNLNSIYTPEIVVNGRTEFIGSDRKRLANVVSEELNKKTDSRIEIKASSNNNKTVSVNYKNAPATGQLINFALLQSSALTDVKRGENKGRQLKHINIVRDFKAIEPAPSGLVLLSLPDGLSAKDCNVIAYLQHKKDGQIVGAAETTIDGIK
ncbi:MAG TPA: DUF1223 domain-containing protein [Puia sp.]|nr:DUF1223 domain-containing protein [Puia sp.]